MLSRLWSRESGKGPAKSGRVQFGSGSLAIRQQSDARQGSGSGPYYGVVRIRRDYCWVRAGEAEGGGYFTA